MPYRIINDEEGWWIVNQQYEILAGPFVTRQGAEANWDNEWSEDQEES